MFNDSEERVLFLHRLTQKTCALQQISAAVTDTMKKSKHQETGGFCYATGAWLASAPLHLNSGIKFWQKVIDRMSCSYSKLASYVNPAYYVVPFLCKYFSLYEKR